MVTGGVPCYGWGGGVDNNHLDSVTDYPAILFTSYLTKNSPLWSWSAPSPLHSEQPTPEAGNPDYDVIWQLICCSVLCTDANPLQPFLTSYLIPSGCIKAVPRHAYWRNTHYYEVRMLYLHFLWFHFTRNTQPRTRYYCFNVRFLILIMTAYTTRTFCSMHGRPSVL